MNSTSGRSLIAVACVISFLNAASVWAADPAGTGAAPAPPKLDPVEMIKAGGAIGYIIIGLSIAALALVFEHAISIRRGALMPHGLAEEVHRLLAAGQFKQAEQYCKEHPSILAYILKSGLAEVQMGYPAVEKALEDASTQQAARLFRKIEFLSVISTIAPMLGLLGTVWGMILAFMEFEAKANPQVAELAPGIYHALVTTLQGLSVAIPAIAAYSFFRNRVDELIAQTALMAEHVFAGYKRSTTTKTTTRDSVKRPEPNAS